MIKGVFEVANIIPAAGYQKEQVLEYAAQAESYSNHPIAKSILAAYGKSIDQKQFSGFEEISGHGISVMVQGKKVLAGNSKLMESEKIAYSACDAAGTKVYVAADGSYVGCILIADEVKPDSNRAIAELKKIGVEKTVMLTGDDERIGKSVADELGLDAYYAQLLPDQKVEKLEMLDRDYLSWMPRTTTRPRLTVQDEQPGTCVELPYYTENPEPDEVQCALAWYTGAFADRERQLGVEILLDALLGSNQAPLKAALLNEKLGADIDIGFDDSTLQPTLELVLRGATEDTAARFAAGVRKAVDDILAEGIPEDLLLASLNAAEFASLERPGSIPDGVLDAINAATSWLHTGDPAMLLHTNSLFASLREKLAKGWFDALLKDLFAAEPVQVTQVPTLPKKEEEAQAARVDGKLVLEHPLTVADLGSGEKSAAGGEEQLAGATLLHHPSAGSTYLNFYYDLGSLTPEEMQYLDLLTDVLDELDTPRHTARELNTLRGTWLGNSSVALSIWTGWSGAWKRPWSWAASGCTRPG